MRRQPHTWRAPSLTRYCSNTILPRRSTSCDALVPYLPWHTLHEETLPHSFFLCVKSIPLFISMISQKVCTHSQTNDCLAGGQGSWLHIPVIFPKRGRKEAQSNESLGWGPLSWLPAHPRGHSPAHLKTSLFSRKPFCFVLDCSHTQSFSLYRPQSSLCERMTSPHPFRLRSPLLALALFPPRTLETRQPLAPPRKLRFEI